MSDRIGKWAALLVVSFLAVFSVQGCAIVNTGHMVDKSRIELIKPGETRGKEIEKWFGKPDATVRKFNDGVTVWSYKSITNTSIGLPIPFFVLMKAKTAGFQLNLVVKDETDIVLDYELSNFSETLSGRDR